MPLSVNFEKGTIVRLILVQTHIMQMYYSYLSLWKKYIKLYSLPQFCMKNSMKSFSIPNFPNLLSLSSHFLSPMLPSVSNLLWTPGTREGSVLSSILYSFDPSPPTLSKILFCQLWLSSIPSPPLVAPSPQLLYINKIIYLFSKEKKSL